MYRGGRQGGRRGWTALAAAAAALLPALPARGAPATADTIVVLRPGAAVTPVLRSVGLAGAAHTYHDVFTGFDAPLDAVARARLAGDPRVAAVLPDDRHPAAQLDALSQDTAVVDNAIRRVGALDSPTAAIDGYDAPVDADIAIVDSGLPSTNPDLNVVGGVDCTGSGTWEDTVGHGTFVAGLAAARDDGRGVVGVAPGARLWAVKVMGSDGTVSDAAYLCGLEWVADNAAAIDVVNISLGGPGNDADCGAGAYDALALEHAAICRIVGAGVVAVAAAGNSGQDAAGTNPAGFPEVITVSASVDTDGRPGGLGPPASCYPGTDDTLASYSDFGTAVAITAPGTCVESTWLGDHYVVASGTSAAAPLVSGAVALVRAVHPEWPVDMVRQFLLATATPGPGDRDGYPEPMLDVAGY
ncbi:MAG TPA: S8 family serine peptidase [Acidimicrobiia bacterium]|nr:S8 family serine peptidase [Acidimicrobiia bacterium]